MWEGGKHNTKHKSIQKNLMMEICFFFVVYVMWYRMYLDIGWLKGKGMRHLLKKMHSLVALTLTARGSTLVDRI